jgi:hypothetical protein
MSNDLLVRSFRSRLNALPFEARCMLGEIPLQKGMYMDSRQQKCIDILRSYNVDFNVVGCGTNRFITKYDGYAVKIALDKEGIADNKQEWAVSEMLDPDVAETFEISNGGHLLVASYFPAFTSANEMFCYSVQIQDILKKWNSRGFLLGDVGLTKVNYANWSPGRNGHPKCIDYGYVFPGSLDLFQCICGCDALTVTDANFTAYQCTKCGHVYQDRDLRNRISATERAKLFGNTTGIRMKEAFENHEIDPKYVVHEYNPSAPDAFQATLDALQMENGGPVPFRV